MCKLKSYSEYNQLVLILHIFSFPLWCFVMSWWFERYMYNANWFETSSLFLWKWVSERTSFKRSKMLKWKQTYWWKQRMRARKSEKERGRETKARRGEVASNHAVVFDGYTCICVWMNGKNVHVHCTMDTLVVRCSVSVIWQSLSLKTHYSYIQCILQ